MTSKEPHGCSDPLVCNGVSPGALFYTLIENAKLVGVEPAAYLHAAAVAAFARRARDAASRDPRVSLNRGPTVVVTRNTGRAARTYNQRRRIASGPRHRSWPL